LLVGLAYEHIATRGVLRRTTYDVPHTSNFPPRTVVSGIVLGLVCLAFTVRTIDRNRDWISAETLMESAMKAYPASAKVHSMLGALAAARADWVETRDHLQTAIGLYPDYLNTEVEINFNLGRMFLSNHETDNAVEAFERAVALDPTSSMT